MNAMKLIFRIAAALTCISLQAHIGPPAKVTLASADAVRRGEPSTIYVVLQAAADVSQAEYNLKPPAGWQVIEGATQWVGSLKAGQRIEFQMRAIPLTDEPGALEATLRIPNAREYKTSLNPDRMGGQFPEMSTAEENGEPVEARFESGIQSAKPADANEPQIPGRPYKQNVVREAPALNSKGQRSATVAINAFGRFTYLDDNSIRRGIRNATVELWNENPLPSLGDERCARGTTNANGDFALSADCGDLFDGPDLFVRLVLNNDIVEVMPDNTFAGSYTFRTTTRQNFAGGDLNFNTLTVNSNRGALQAHNIIMRAHQFMATLDESMSKVTVHFPGQGTFYQPAFDSITLTSDVPFGEEGAIYHEYGHHILSTKAESPSPDYDNGICDDPDPGHCLFQPENGRISWTEGWPNFFGAFLHARHNAEDGYGPTMMQFETIPTLNLAASQLDNVEGVIAAILWDLTDSADDDQGTQGAGRRDNLDMSFAEIWNVVRNFDPSSDLFHNHPTSIHELFDGLREMEPASINRIAEVYREHGIVKPQPDLRITAIQAPPTTLVRGTTFSLSATARNEGDERADSGFTVRYQLQNQATGALVLLGTRTVPANLIAGSSSSASATLTVPQTTVAGTYRVRVCADSTGGVPESDESDNCAVTVGTSVVP